MENSKLPEVPDHPSDTSTADQLSQLCGMVATRLTGMRPAPNRAKDLRTHVLHQVHSSVLAHREYTTIRMEDGEWVHAARGVDRRLLRSDAGTRVEVQRLSPGATLPWPDDARAQEILLLDGSLSIAGCVASPIGVPGAAGYIVRPRSDADAPLVAATDATAYVRHLLVDGAQLPALEARWWELACASSGWVDPGRKRWHSITEGVDVLPLRGDTEVISMLVRFAAGACVPDHGHALDEDCLVLQGEMFLGDILLRAGDYQLAPAGGTHFGETSDVGAMFYFHGALDPVLRGVSPAGRQ